MPARHVSRGSGGVTSYERCRELIKTREVIQHIQSKLLNGETFTSNEIGAAKILLDRALPTLTSIELAGAVDLNVSEITVTVKNEAKL